MSSVGSLTAMADLIIGILVLGGLAALIGAIVVGGRRQRAARSAALRRAADRLGFTYLATDDGRAQRLAVGLGEFAHFRSPSLGTLVPSDVIHHVDEGTEVVAFRHHTRTTDEGNARHWYVAIAERHDATPCRSLIRMRDRSVRRVAGVLTGRRQVGFPDDPAFDRRFMTDGPDEDTTRRHVTAAVRRCIVDLAASTGFAVDVHLQGKRTAAISAGRNRDLDSDEILRLVDVARTVARNRA